MGRKQPNRNIASGAGVLLSAKSKSATPATTPKPVSAAQTERNGCRTGRTEEHASVWIHRNKNMFLTPKRSCGTGLSNEGGCAMIGNRAKANPTNGALWLDHWTNVFADALRFMTDLWHMKTIEGREAEKSIQADLGNGFATYASVDGKWYSVNIDHAGLITDVRWTASIRERDQIVSILARRLRQ
jgi:hypothetical protein